MSSRIENSTLHAGVARFISFYEELSADTLPRLTEVYHADAHFRDPFNDVRGSAAIKHVFDDMFETLEYARFVIIEHMAQGEQAFFTWKLYCRMRRWQREELCIEGASHVCFDADGLVVDHRDYWDKAEELYERFPVLGPLMRTLRRAGAA